MRYPLGEHEKDSIRSKTGKRLDDINLEAVIKGKITADDIKISKETLIKQAQVARSVDNVQLGENFERAAELVDVPDDVIMTIYNKLRPNRSTKQELLDIADELKSKYKAVKCANLVLEAVDIYEKRGVLL